VAFIESRLRIAEEWLSAESARELEPARLAALAMARVVEILPFEAGNGRVARLAASHLLVRGGGRPPILVSGDERRLVQCLQAAFQFELEPLATLLEEAEGRALDVMLQTLESAR
jgi:Fic family protein